MLFELLDLNAISIVAVVLSGLLRLNNSNTFEMNVFLMVRACNLAPGDVQNARDHRQTPKWARMATRGAQSKTVPGGPVFRVRTETGPKWHARRQ